MNCTRCGTALAPGATFCMQCGQMFGVTLGGAAAVPIDAKRNLLPFAVGAVAALVAVLGGLMASGLLRFGSGPSEAVLRVPAKPPPSVLAKRDDAPEPGLAKTGIKMPDDVRAWLEHLERIEKKKNELHAEQLSDASVTKMMLEGASGLTVEDVGTFSDPDASVPDPRASIEKTIKGMAEPWRDLEKEFMTTGPRIPSECQPLASAYDRALTDIPSWIDEISGMMMGFDPTAPNPQANVKDARAKGRDIKGQHKLSVDASLANSDRMLADICRKYETAKWFDINTGTLAGSPLGR